MLELIALLLPFIVLGLIGLFIVVLLNEVGKQYEHSIPIQSILNWLIILFIVGVIIYASINSSLPSAVFSLIPVVWWKTSDSSQEQPLQPRQRYQRVPKPKAQQQRVLITPPSRNFVSPPKPVQPSQKNISKQQQINHLEPKLLNLMNGDRDGAERLLRHAKRNNPGMNETWYFEKVIADLERDRR